jgi:hypothetical protein
MNWKKYIISSLVLISVLFSTCKDPLGGDDPVTVTAVSFLPVRNLSYYSFYLYWIKYESDNFARYEIYCKSDSLGRYSLYYTATDIDRTNLSLYGLQPSHTYWFYIKVIGEDGEYADSEILKVTTRSDTPSAVSIDGLDAGSEYYIYWNRYTDVDVVTFSRYEVYCTHYSDYNNLINYLWYKTSYIKNNYFYITKSEMDKNAPYYFKVRTYNGLGKYSESASLEIINP